MSESDSSSNLIEDPDEFLLEEITEILKTKEVVEETNRNFNPEYYKMKFPFEAKINEINRNTFGN